MGLSIYRVVVFVWVVLYSHGWKRVVVFVTSGVVVFNGSLYYRVYGIIVDDGVPNEVVNWFSLWAR